MVSCPDHYDRTRSLLHRAALAKKKGDKGWMLYPNHAPCHSLCLSLAYWPTPLQFPNLSGRLFFQSEQATPELCQVLDLGIDAQGQLRITPLMTSTHDARVTLMSE